MEGNLSQRRKSAKRLFRFVLYGAAVGVLAGLALEARYVLLGTNFHVVIPGRVYRCAQPSGEKLAQTIQEKGIRTVVNLRGCSAPFSWYMEESRTTHRLSIAQEDICLSSGRMPAVHEMRQLLAVLDQVEYPLLLHCRRGADRTGLVSAVVLLSQTDCSLEKARGQLGLRYGHLALGRLRFLDDFLDLYSAWLKESRLHHSPDVFRQWLLAGYCPGKWQCRLEPLDIPERVQTGRPVGLQVRAYNTGKQAWHLRPENNAGVHVGYILLDDHNQWLANGRSGLFEKDVPPGQGIDLTLVLPAMKNTGRYRLLVDMVDERHGWFFQTNSEPLERELEIVE